MATTTTATKALRSAKFLHHGFSTRILVETYRRSGGSPIARGLLHPMGLASPKWNSRQRTAAYHSSVAQHSTVTDASQNYTRGTRSPQSAPSMPLLFHRNMTSLTLGRNGWRNKIRADSVLHSTISFRYFSSESAKDKPENDSAESETKRSENDILYESPYGGTVLRLRGLSLFTGFAGAVGFPISYLSKGGDPTTLKFWLLSGALGMAAMSTTVIITYIFTPYVYKIEAVPIRKCHYTKKNKDDDDSTTPASKTDQEDAAKEDESMETEKTSSTESQSDEPQLYVASTRTMFLFSKPVFFDPTTDLHPYSGITHPLCNIRVSKASSESKDDDFLYVHPELCYESQLSKIVALGDPGTAVGDAKDGLIKKRTNPDDELK